MKTNDTHARAAFERGDFATAETLFRNALATSPDDAVGYYNLGVTLAKLDRFEEAMGCYRAAIERNPHFADAYANFGFCLNELNLIAQARQAFAIARQMNPDDPVPVLNEGIAALALGDYAAGWQGFDARWRLPAYAKFKRRFDRPEWDGGDLSGKILFLYAEQGFGDTLQMARFIPLLSARGAQVVVEAPPALVELLRTMPGDARIIAKGKNVPEFDVYCAMMDLPRLMDTEIETIPSATPYLGADPVLVAHYQELLPRNGKVRIGLSWAGRASHENDRKRSLSLKQLAPFFAAPGVQWVGLQKLVPASDAEILPTLDMLDWGTGFPDFAATAAAIRALDLIITVDTAIAHLAGALGKPVWVLLPFYADWRWMAGREDSPWYPTATLFRQPARGDWGSVIERVARELG